MSRTCRHTTALAFFGAFLLYSTLMLAPGAALARDAAETEDDRDSVVLSFSTVGDSRQDPTGADPTTLPLSGQDQKFLQNTKAWARIMRSIGNQGSNLLFFNGDMIMGYGKAGIPPDVSTVDAVVKSDLVQFERQYGYWRGMVAGLMETGTYVVPVPGNHEMQCSDKVSKYCTKKGKNAEVENENAWRDNMGDLILDTARLQKMFPDWSSNGYWNPDNTPLVGSPDNISTDQKQLSYSFDFRGSHFVVIDTDPVGYDAHAPIYWLAQDLAAARVRGAQHFFVFGHKPAFTYVYAGADPTKASGFDANPANRDMFWALMEQYGATYFCGHEHTFNMSQPTAASGGQAWQVLVGAGGSPFDAAVAGVPTDRMYSWAKVSIYASGKVKIKAYGFDDQFGPTQVLQSVTLPY